MEFYWLTLGILAVWRITHLLTHEDGPFDLFARLREAIGDGFWGNLLDCFNCLSLWVSLPFALMLGHNVQEKVMLWLAYSGGSIILERVSSEKPSTVPLYWEEEEDKHELLRKSSSPE